MNVNVNINVAQGLESIEHYAKEITYQMGLIADFDRRVQPHREAWIEAQGLMLDHALELLLTGVATEVIMEAMARYGSPGEEGYGRMARERFHADLGDRRRLRMVQREGQEHEERKAVRA